MWCNYWLFHLWSEWKPSVKVHAALVTDKGQWIACQIRRCQRCGFTEVQDVGNREYVLLLNETPAVQQEAGGPQSTTVDNKEQ